MGEFYGKVLQVSTGHLGKKFAGEFCERFLWNSFAEDFCRRFCERVLKESIVSEFFKKFWEVS